MPSSAAQTGALNGERGVGNRPTSAKTTNHGVMGNPGLVQEDLVEEGLTGHLAQRSNLDTGLVHVNDEVGDALVLRGVRVGPGNEHALLGHVPAGRPDLLAGDDPLVAVPDRLGLQPGQVRPGTRLGEELAPCDGAVQDLRYVAVHLLGRAVYGNGRGCQHQAQARGRPDDIRLGQDRRDL